MSSRRFGLPASRRFLRLCIWNFVWAVGLSVAGSVRAVDVNAFVTDQYRSVVTPTAEGLGIASTNAVMPPIATAKNLNLAITNNQWLVVRMKANKGAYAGLWIAPSNTTAWYPSQTKIEDQFAFPIRTDGEFHTYNVWLGNYRLMPLKPGQTYNTAISYKFRLVQTALTGTIQQMAVIPTYAPFETGVVASLDFRTQPDGSPPVLVVEYAGDAIGLNRPGRAGTIAVRVRNVGGSPATGLTAAFAGDAPLAFDQATLRQVPATLGVDQVKTFYIDVTASAAGKHNFTVNVGCAQGDHASTSNTYAVESPYVATTPLGTIPPPVPLHTGYDIGCWYFPAWSTLTHWVATAFAAERMPLLGSYDELSVRNADWTIKWAVEHGIDYFTFLWYVSSTPGAMHSSNRFLSNYFIHSQFIDSIKFNVGWCTDANTAVIDEAHFNADFNYALDHFFSLPSYKKTADGRPIYTIYAGHTFVNTLGVPRAEALLADCEARARSRGFPGVYWIGGYTESNATKFANAGIDGQCYYNWIGTRNGLQGKVPEGLFPVAPAEIYYNDAPATWNAMTQHPELDTYLPVSAGFEDRIWHGGKTPRAFYDNTPEKFRQHLQDAKDYMDARGLKTVFIENWSEWGEGALIGPHAQFGFEYLQAIPAVFAPGSTPAAPVGPDDVGAQVEQIAGLYDIVDFTPARVITDLPPAITSDLAVGGRVGEAFSYQIAATHSPTTFTAAGLPSGLTLDPVTGLISGTPAAGTQGTWTVALGAANAFGAGAANLSLAIAPPGAANLVYDYAGNYVAANVNLGTAATAGVGNYGTNGGANTAFDVRAVLDFDNNRPLTPTAGYSGPAFYGAAVRTDYDYAAAPAWTTQSTARVGDNTTSDFLFFSVGGTGSGFTTPPGGTTAAALFYFQQRDFINGGSTGTVSVQPGDPGLSIGIGSTANFAITSVFTDTNGRNNARWMIRLGGQMYLSSATLNIPYNTTSNVRQFSSYTLSGGAALAMTWAPYDPASSIYFDPTAVTFTTLPGLNNVTAFGVYAGVRYPPGTTPSASHGPQSFFAVSAASANLTVTAPVPPVLGGHLDATGRVNTAFSYQIVASNSPTAYAATGLPAGLGLDPATGVISGTPLTAGSFAVGVGATNAGGTATGTLTLTIDPAEAEVTLNGLHYVYDGSARSVAVTTVPAGLPVAVTYDGETTPPSAAGTYEVVATVTDPNYAGEATELLVIEPAPVVVTLGGLQQTYDGTPKSVTAGTMPAGPALAVTYNGSAVLPIGAGSYAVVATVIDPNYVGEAVGTLAIAKATATIALDGLVQFYDGTPKSVVVVTDPAGLAVDITYDGGATPPIYPGSHTASVAIDDPNYRGLAGGVLRIGITALVRHAPTLNGDLDGSAQVLLAENVTMNGDAGLYGDLLMSGSPAVQLNGRPQFGGTVEGLGAVAPTNHRVTLTGSALLGRLVRRVDAIALPEVATPPTPTGTVDVAINSTGQGFGDPANLRNLTVNASGAAVALPPGTYGTIVLNGQSTLVLGTAGAETETVYNFQGLTLNGNSRIVLAGPVVLRVAGNAVLNGGVNTDHTASLRLEIATGGLTLNGGAELWGDVVAPAGTVVLNGNTRLNGSVASDRLTINGAGWLIETAP